MIVTIANFILIIAAIFTSTYQFTPIKYIKATNIIIFLSITCCVIMLIYAHITDNFSLANVYYNSHTTKPLVFKIFGIWGNKEGSILLLTWILTFYAVLLEISLKHKKLKRTTLIIQHLIVFVFILLMILDSNPFIEMVPVPTNGLGFNPMLQDIALAIHPPTLYMGYIGSSIVFSLTLAALILKFNAIQLIKYIRPWILLSWSFLTLGIALGSWWAYRELGWGGFWFWDPVENVSLMPWLILTALVHSTLLTKNLNACQNLNIILSILVFILSLIGTFLTRSGLLISVHTFTNDLNSSIYLLVIIILVIICSTIIIAKSSIDQLTPVSKFYLTSKPSVILLNVLITITAFTVVCIGTLLPLILELILGYKISVGSSYYNSILQYLVIASLFLMIISPNLSWQKKLTSFKSIFYKYKISILTSSVICPFVISASNDYITSIIIIFAIALIIILIEDYAHKILSIKSLSNIKFTKNFNASYHSMIISHIGVSILILGIVSCTSFEKEKELYMKVGESVNIDQFNIQLTELSLSSQQNFQAITGYFIIKNGNKFLGKINPQYRFYLVEGIKNVESDILHYNLLSNIYIVIGEIDKNLGIAVKIYVKPFINAIWLGFFLISISFIFKILKNILLKQILRKYSKKNS